MCILLFLLLYYYFLVLAFVFSVTSFLVH